LSTTKPEMRRIRNKNLHLSVSRIEVGTTDSKNKRKANEDFSGNVRNYYYTIEHQNEGDLADKPTTIIPSERNKRRQSSMYSRQESAEKSMTINSSAKIHLNKKSGKIKPTYTNSKSQLGRGKMILIFRICA
jgi:hypothetical protein